MSTNSAFLAGRFAYEYSFFLLAKLITRFSKLIRLKCGIGNHGEAIALRNPLIPLKFQAIPSNQSEPSLF